MKYVFLVIFFLALNLDASYIRSIRIGTYPNETSAKEALQKVLSYVDKYPEIKELEKQNIFEFKVRRSGNYFVCVSEPFVDKSNLQTVLDVLRKSYKDAYVTKLSKLPTTKKKILKKKKEQREHSLKKKENIKKEKLKIDDIVTQTKVENIKKHLLEIEAEEKKKITVTGVNNLQKNTKIIKKEHKTKKIENRDDDGFFFVYIGLFFIIMIFVIAYLIYMIKKYKKRIAYHEDKGLEYREKNIQLEKSLENKSNLISYVSHELRTPMTAIMGLVHLLQEENLAGKQKDYVSKIENSSEHLLNLVNDILDVSKIDSGELKLEQNEFNINDILGYVINVNAIKAKANNTSLNIEVDNDVPSKVIGDSLRIGQVLINLIGNATKFTHDGDITLKVEKLASEFETVTLKFSVSDTGIGMTDEQVNKIFNSFYQAEDSTSRKFGGTGLGLSISKNLVEKMGGSINVTSQKGVGTTFYFTINFKLKDSQNKRQYRLPSAKLLGKKILIVDPSNKNVISLINLFGYFNYQVNSIPSFDGSDIDLNSRYDIIVVDQHILTNDSIKILKKMKVNSGAKIVITSEVHSGLSSNILDNIDIDFYLEMPCTQQNILNMIVDLYISKNNNSVPKKISVKDKLKKLSNKKILIAEDNEINQKVIAGLLANLDLELTFVDNGEDAVKMVKKGMDFDLILMDINMPKLNGYEASKQIREYPKYDDVQIFALSGDVTQEAIENSLSSGMQGHISKPIIIDQFYKTLLDALQIKDKKPIIEPTILPSSIDEIDNNEEYTELSIDDGLLRCENDMDFYKSILIEFKNIYRSSPSSLEELCVKDDFKKARKMSMDIKDVALNIGAYNLCESAASMEYEFEKGSRGNWWENISLYEKSLYKLFDEIDKYLRS